MFTRDKLEISVFNDGDRNVGLNGIDMKVTIEVNTEFRSLIREDENRKLMRADLRKFFVAWLDEEVDVRFDDECPDCMQVFKTEEKLSKHLKHGDCPALMKERGDQ